MRRNYCWAISYLWCYREEVACVRPVNTVDRAVVVTIVQILAEKRPSTGRWREDLQPMQFRVM
jgi:hypothetical protein